MTKKIIDANKFTKLEAQVKRMLEKKPKVLNVEPLSVAKFFYEKGVEDIAIIQRLIYLVYCEILEKENLILFGEKWQAWNSGTVVESVFYEMRRSLDKKKLFKKVIFLENEVILKYCEDLFNRYQESIKEDEEFEFLQNSLNEPWKIARLDLSDELEKSEIKTINIINFFIKKKEKNIKRQ